MRWFVEISSLGASAEPPVKLCVEAPQWQPALQKARALRGDEGPLSNFSIELLDEGYRAVDPATRQRYFVRKAPDDAPLTTSMPSAAPAAPVAKPEPLAEDKPGAPAPEKPNVRAPMQTSPFGSTGSAAIRPGGETPAPAPATAPAPARPLPPKKATVQGMPAAAAPIRKPTVPGMLAAAGASPSPVTSTPAPPATRASSPSIVTHKVHSSREENATASSPLTYREFVYVVAEGTNEDAAKTLLLDRLDNVAKGLGDVQGKLVQMAVFDHAYQGRPQRKPIATLKWRDWRGEPEVVFPSRPEGEQPKETQAKEAPQPVRPASTPPPARVSATPIPARVVPAAKPSAPVAPRIPAPATRPSSPALRASTPAPPRASTPAPPKASVPPARIKSTDEVMAELSGAVTDLHFMRDALEGADFVVTLVGEKFPSEVVLVWLHDADKRELVLVRQTGGKTDQLLSRISDKQGLAQAALRSQRAVVIPDATRDPRANEARWKTMGVEPKSIVVAPVMASGKPYGLIEILNPKSGGRFGTIENNGLTYIGQQLAEFIATNGVILDSDRILAGAKRIAT